MAPHKAISPGNPTELPTESVRHLPKGKVLILRQPKVSRLLQLKVSLYAEHKGDDAEPNDRGADRCDGTLISHVR